MSANTRDPCETYGFHNHKNSTETEPALFQAYKTYEALDNKH